MRITFGHDPKIDLGDEIELLEKKDDQDYGIGAGDTYAIRSADRSSRSVQERVVVGKSFTREEHCEINNWVKNMKIPNSIKCFCKYFGG